MSQHNDIDRVLDLWLAEGPTQVPDRVFDDAIARVDRQPQHSAWRTRLRIFEMTTSLRLLATAVAIIALVGVGIVVLRPSSSVGEGPSPTVSLAPSQSPTRLPSSGPIEPGRYFIEKGPQSAATFSFTVPAGWMGDSGGLRKHPDDSEREIAWGPTVVEAVFADPCGSNETVTVGPTADDLIGALSTLPGLEVADPVDTTIGDRPGTSVELTVLPTVDVAACDPPIGLQVWVDQAGSYLLVDESVPAVVVTADLEDGRFVLASSRHETTPSADVAELAAILASISFEP
jgi:hypothetical protein